MKIFKQIAYWLWISFFLLCIVLFINIAMQFTVKGIQDWDKTYEVLVWLSSYKIQEEQMEKGYKLTIEPAIPPEQRHKISDLLREMGYAVWGTGQDDDGSRCDITFDEK